METIIDICGVTIAVAFTSFVVVVVIALIKGILDQFFS